MVNDFQNVGLLQTGDRLSLFVVVHEDDLLAPGTQQVIPGQRADNVLVLI